MSRDPMMSRRVMIELRERYSETWNTEWPEDDTFLSELWFEAKRDLGVAVRSKKHGRAVKVLTLELMKENT